MWCMGRGAPGGGPAREREQGACQGGSGAGGRRGFGRKRILSKLKIRYFVEPREKTTPAASHPKNAPAENRPVPGHPSIAHRGPSDRHASLSSVLQTTDGPYYRNPTASTPARRPLP